LESTKGGSVMVAIRNEKDFWAGVIYVTVGVVALWFGQTYSMGTSAHMGPGYFPKVLAGMLILIGGISLIRAYLKRGEAAGKLAWRPLFLVLGACALFSLLLNTAGLIVALLALVLVSASASRKFSFDLMATLGLVGLIAFCSLVVVKGLGVPMPLL
jgi:Tripartite tricarboxylate transporter TctB family